MSSLTVEEDQKWLPTHVQVTVLRGRDLRGKGKHGTSDVYTIIQLGKEKYSTGVAEKTTEPEWREECSFELQPGVLESGSPAGSNELVLTVMHRALIGMDVFLGQAVVRLDKVFHETRSLKNEWYRLNSKTGKKEKERGDIQLCVQFSRNNLTASMYDLVMKDKSASTFSKLKDHMKGKRRSSDKDSSSAVLPSGYGSLYRMRQRLPSDGGGEEDYEDDEGGEARRSKMRTFFLRGKLRKSSDTRSSTSLGSESSESSSRGGSLSPTAGISVVVSDLSNSPSNSSNLTADNSPEHTSNTSPKFSSLKCEFGDEEEAGEITIVVPQPTVCVNGSHVYNVQPLDSGSGNPAGSLGLGLLHKSLPLSMSLQNLSPRASADVPGGPAGLAGPAGDGRRWSFDKPDEEEKAAIAAALEKSGPMVSEEEQEQEQEERLGGDALSKAASTESEIQGRKQRRNLFSLGRSESAGKSPSQADQAAAEEKHKGWFGSKDSHSKPSTDPHPPRLPPNRPPSVDPALEVSSLHHTNPFCPSQSSPPPISRCNPFFSLLQPNPFSDGDMQTAEPPRPSRPPLPYLSIARPPIARLFPQTSDQMHKKQHVAEVCRDATRDGAEMVRRRPLPPVPSEKQPLLRRSSNPFMSVEEREVDPEWDESFEAFAACRLQPPDQRAAESRMQQNASSDRPLERCSHQRALLPLMEADENTNVNNALHHQTLSFDKVAKQVTTFSSHRPDASPHVLEMIPEHRSFESDDTNFPNADFIETKQQSSTTHEVTESDVHGAPCQTPSVHLSSSSPEVTSSGIGSAADEDFLSCFSSQSDKLSASSSEETENNFLSFGKPTVVKRRLESEDEITDSSTDPSLDDAAHQHRNGDTGKVDQSGSEGSFALCSLLHSHPHPGFTTEAGTGGVDTQTTQIPKSIDSLKSEESKIDFCNISCGDFFEDWSTLSFHVATSSPVQQRLLDPSCESVGEPNQKAANLKDTDVSNQSSSSFLLKLNVSCDSNDYHTCESRPSSECSDVSTLCGNADTNATIPASSSGLENLEKPFNGGNVQSNGLEGSLSGPQTLEAPPAGLTDSYKSCSEGGVEDQHDVFMKFNQLEIATLHRSQSEGTLAPIFGHLQPSFGSDPGALQLSSLAPPPSGLPSLTLFALSLTSESCTSPVALRSFPPPLLANALPKSPPGAARVFTPTSPETEPPHQQGVEPQTSPHPVRPLSTAMQTEEKRSVLATGLEKLKSTIHPGRSSSSSSSSQPTETEADRKKPLTEGAGSYYHLTHSELVALLVQREAELRRQRADFQRQKLLLAKREVELRRLKPQVRDLEDYIDTLLVRIMEQKPTLLQVRSKLK